MPGEKHEHVGPAPWQRQRGEFGAAGRVLQQHGVARLQQVGPVVERIAGIGPGGTEDQYRTLVGRLWKSQGRVGQ